jgi:predicted AlkP superfamily phosphohydrolase/phosphomutase
MQKNRVVLIGLDAFDPELAANWAAAGDLPTIARLFAKGARAPVHNPFGLFVGALWVNFASCWRPDRHRFHCWDEVDPQTYQWRLNPPRPDRYDSFWKRIGDSGRRVAAIDVPHSRAPQSINGVEIAEWGCHDRHFGLRSCPTDRAATLAAEHGTHPAFGVDPYAMRDFAPDDFIHRQGLLRTPDEDQALLDGLTVGAGTKGALMASVLREEPWDLFLGVFGESHAVGHQLYHLHDRSHPRFDAQAQEGLGGDPVLRVYKAIDAALARLLDHVPPDALLLVHLSHGITVHNDGTHLLDEVLALLDRDPSSPRPYGRLRQAAKHVVPALRPLVSALRVPASLKRFLGQWLRRELPHHRAGRRFYLSPNNYVYSGIRLNLTGREAHGKVEPDHFDGVCRDLEQDLLELINVDTGKPAIRSVVRCDDHHRRRADDTMPDLFVEWDRSAPIQTVFSPRIGTVHTPYSGWRSGDHSPDGLLLALGPDIAARELLPPLCVEDIGASIAARLGVPLDDVDGEPVSWLADGPESGAGEKGFASAAR